MSRSNQNLVGAVLISSAFFLFFYMIIQTYSDIGILKVAVARREEILTSKKNLISKVAQLKAIYESKKDEIDKISSVVPDKKQLPEIVSSFEFMASSTGLTLANLTIAGIQEDEATPIRTIPFQNKIRGEYLPFRNFLNLVETNRRLIDINTATLILENAGAISIEMAGKIYVLK